MTDGPVFRAKTRRIALLLGVLTLGIGPWLGLYGTSFVAAPSAALAAGDTGGPGERALGQVGPQRVPPSPQRMRLLSSATGCSCREVVVDASNVVRDAEIRTGDASMINRSITYIAPSYGDTEVEVEQEAEAITGDAVAGQILAVDGGGGCSRVTVTAKNVVEDVQLRTGDAVAKNKSVVLIDPSIKREDLEIEIDQEAVAESGDAIAGQIIGVKGGGPCGGVILNALNRVRNVELRTGDAITENISDILTCDDVGCIDDIKRMLGNVKAVDVCNADGCRAVPVKEFIEILKEQAEAPEVVPADEEEPDADAPRNVQSDSDDDESDEDGKWREEGEYVASHPRIKDLPDRTKPEDDEPSGPTPTPEPTPF